MICSTTSGAPGVCTSNSSGGWSVRLTIAFSPSLDVRRSTFGVRRLPTVPSPATTNGTSSSSPIRSRLCGKYPLFPTTLFLISNSAGVALTYAIWFVISMNSLKFSGRLSSALGSRKPYSTSTVFRDRSPSYIPPICGIVACDSSTTSRKSFGKKSRSVNGFEPGSRPERCRE